jgi:hypothetical protein
LRSGKRLQLGLALLASGTLFLLGGGPGSEAATGADPIFTIAGTGTSGYAGDGGPAISAQINQPRNIAPTADGGYVFAEPFNNDARRVSADGTITTLAGTGVAGFSGDGGPATAAQLNFVHAASPTPDGGYLLADELNNRIRKVSASGTITTVAGNGDPVYGGDGGPATAAAINNPRGVASLADGGFLIPDSNNHRVRRVWPDGTITTVAGTGVQGFSGDGGPATSARLSIPFGVAPTADGGFLIVDVGNQRIRLVSSSGTITTVAGTGVGGYSGDGGPATAAQVNNPHNVWPLADGSFFFADASNSRIRLVAADGTISTEVGTGVPDFGGDGGPANAAPIAFPKAVAVDAAGNLLVADTSNNRIRFVGPATTPANLSSPGISGAPRSGQTLTASAGGWTGVPPPTKTYQWQRCDAAGTACMDIAFANSATYVLGAPDVGSTLLVVVTATNIAGAASASSAPTSVVTEAPSPPTNTSPPTISGTAQDGATLTADPGTWSGTPPISYAYQWVRCNASGGGCQDIATLGDRSYYTLGPADVGTTLRVRIAATNGAGTSAYASAVNADNPTSYWRFDDSNVTLADVRGFKNGVYLNSPQRGVRGLVVGDADTATSFNGTNQYADVQADSAWTPPNFSLEISVKPSTLAANRTIWSTMGAFRGWWLNTGPTGALRLFIGDGSNWQTGPPGPVLDGGTTHHIVATYDGTNGRVYVDGNLVATSPAVAMVRDVTGNVMRFGAFSTGPGQYWPGVLDDASFYGFALSASQVAAHYQQSLSAGSTATSDASQLVVAAPPANTGLPVVSGVAQDGQTLSASTGSWSGTQPLSYAYQWRRCDSGGAACTSVGGDSSTYALSGTDVGSTLRVIVTASNSAGFASATSDQTAVVVAAGTSTTVTFSLAGSGDDGDLRLTGSGYPPVGAVAGNTSGSFVTTGRRFVFGGYDVFNALMRFDTSAIPDGATVTGATLRLQVTAKQNADARNLVAEWYDSANWPIDGGDYALGSSANALAGSAIAQIVVGSQNDFALSGLGSLSKTGFSGLRLQVDGGQPSGDNFVQVASFDHATLPEPQLVVTYTTGPPPPDTPPANTGLPVVSGVAQDGQTLSASTGSWSGTQPLSYAYQWRRCDSGGAACTSVGGDSSTYALSGTDVGSTLRVIVTASNSAGFASATSDQTAVVVAAGTSTTVTFSLAGSGDDGDLRLTGSGYPPVGAVAGNTSGSFVTTGRRFVFGGYDVFNALMRFDTSAIPDGATVTGATLRLQVTAKQNADARNLVAEWYDSANWPIDGGDYALGSSANALAGSAIAQIVVGSQNDFALSGLGSLSKTGFSGLRLQVDGGQPSGDNFVQVASFDHATLPEPQLVVTYTP